MDKTKSTVDWQHWLNRWEEQQSHVVHMRDQRFQTMFDVLDVVFEDRPFVVIDLASGPGSISRRVLERFPQARCVAIDLDPVLIAIGRQALGTQGGRLRFVETDLRDPSWAENLGEEQVDAVLTSTALHWIPAGDLVQVYRNVAQVVHPGGVFINCDNMPFPARLETIQRITERLLARRRDARDHVEGLETFQDWWDAVSQDAGLRELYEERQRRFAWRHTGAYRPGIAMHRSILEEAGFREVDTILQNGNNRVLIAVR